jgi:hypothetical protein
MSFFPHVRRAVEPAYAHALHETRAVLSATCARLANCSSSRLPGRAVGSLCELQRATDQLAETSAPRNERAHHQLLKALNELQEEVAELARRGGPPDAILHSRGLHRAEQALSRLSA